MRRPVLEITAAFGSPFPAFRDALLRPACSVPQRFAAFRATASIARLETRISRIKHETFHILDLYCISKKLSYLKLLGMPIGGPIGFRRLNTRQFFLLVIHFFWTRSGEARDVQPNEI